MSIQLDLNTLSNTFEIPLSSINDAKPNTKQNKSFVFKYSEIEIKDATSSIYYTENDLTVLIAIYGPKETKFKEKLKPNKSNIEVYTKFNIDISKEEVMSINYQIKKYLKNLILATSYPKCQINVVINILNYTQQNNDFNLFATIYNGISFALCLSGIDMKALALSKAFNLNGSKRALVTLDANDGDRILLIENNMPLEMNEYDKLILNAKKENELLYNQIKNILFNKLNNS